MGRPRKPKGKKRDPISVSLPTDLIAQWDQIIGPKRTRSRWLEALLRREFIGKQSALIETAWHCQDCGRFWKWPKSYASLCIDKKCRSDKLEQWTLEQFDEEIEQSMEALE